MPLETATYLDDLTASNPAGTDLLRQTDDHLRLIKTVLKATFPSLNFARYIEQPRIDVPDSSTPDLWAAESDYGNLLGTTTITGFASGEEGQCKLVRLATARQLTHHATTLALPGGANITTVAGDHMLVRCTGTTGNVVIGYFRADGKALAETDILPAVTAADLGKAVVLTDDSPKTVGFAFSPPVGSIVAWPTETAPSGWLELNGASLLRATYPLLFALIGDDYGAVDGTHFNLPDMRGRFLRGWANGQTTDPDAGDRTDRGDTTTGDHVGTKQADQIKLHGHPVRDSNTSESNQGTGGYTLSTAGAANSAVFTGTPTNTRGQQIGGTGGDETRPININVMWIIKADV